MVVNFAGSQQLAVGDGVQILQPHRPLWRTFMLTTINPVLYYRCNESTGSNLTNYGSVAASDAAVLGSTNLTYQVAGQLGTAEAIQQLGTGASGSQAVFTTPFQAGWASLTAWEIVFVAKINASLATNRLFGTSIGPGLQVITAGSNFLRAAVRNSATTNFLATSTTALSLNQWYLINFKYDDAGDRKPHLYVNGTEVTYSLQQTLTGTLESPSLGYTWMNTGARNNSSQLSIDEIAVSRVWTSTERTYGNSLIGTH